MADAIPEMVDLMFDLDGGAVPAAYPFLLWREIVRLAPRLAEEHLVGVLPLRTSESREALLLPKRAKLVLRLPASLAGYATERLSGQRLDLSVNGKSSGECALTLGKSRLNQIQPYPTIHAGLVTGPEDEEIFTSNIRLKLGEMGIEGKLICGKRRTLSNGQQTIHGFSLVIHDLKPMASLKLLYAGLGNERKFGCGIFVPHKTISGL